MESAAGHHEAGSHGLRRGEMTSLRRADVDLARRKLHVARSSWRGIEDLPKGGRDRYVDISPALLAALAKVTGDRVLGTTHENMLRCWMAEATERAGLTRVSPLRRARSPRIIGAWAERR